MATPAADLLPPWLAALAAADRSPRTVARYAACVRRFLVWYAAAERAPLTLVSLTPIALVGYRRALQTTEATSTVNTHVAALHAWGAWLAEQGHLAANPATALKRIARVAPPAPAGLSDAAVHALLRAAAQARHPLQTTALVQLLVQTGMRLGECQALTWADVELGVRSGRVLIRAGKGNKAREVPLNGSARAALVAYTAPLLAVEAMPEAVAAAWPARAAVRPPLPLWIGQKGTPLDASALWRIITNLVRTCAARELVPAATTPHDLRHTFAHRYLAAHPGDLVGLARLLGHSSLDTTAIYTQPTAQELGARLEELPLNAYGNEARPARAARAAR